MSKAPDLSAFPIPRKGGARPMELDETPARGAPSPTTEGEGGTPTAPQPLPAAAPARTIQGAPPKKAQTQHVCLEEMPTPVSSGQTVATTVKLDVNRYLRLADAGRPGPGRLKRGTIQEMVIEALDEWFDRRGL